MRRSYNKKIEGLLGANHIKCGVYKITCTTNGKYYIGSTNMTFGKRLAHHVSLLRSGKHKNKHMQHCWNKYGEDNFKYSIILLCSPQDTLKEEQCVLDSVWGDKKLLNINPNATGTPNLSQETIDKRAATMRRKYKTGELVPYFKGKETWNKGLTKDNHDYSYLRVPKTMTKALREAHKNTSDRGRDRSPTVLVLSGTGEGLGSRRSAKDLEDWSWTPENNLPVKSRFYTPRMGVPVNVLQAVNIIKAAKTGKPYKGLY